MEETTASVSDVTFGGTGQESPNTTITNNTDKKVSGTVAVYAIVFILVSIVGTLILINKKSSIWFYLLLFLIIAPMVSTASGALYISMKK